MFVVLFGAVPAAGQRGADPTETGGVKRLQSVVLGEERVIDVILPNGYANSSERYPVIVVLDGSSNAALTATDAQYYAATGRMPATIVVGVRNTNRARDFTPRPVAGFTVPPAITSAGGADAFLAFLADEVIPYLDRTYRTVPMRVIVGHSLGGLFALYALGTRPDLFRGYIVIEPSTWWNGEAELRAAREVLLRPEGRHARLIGVHMSPIGLDTTRFGDTAPMVRGLSVPGDAHESVPVIGIPLALRTLFSDFVAPGWKPGTKPIAILDRYDSLAARVGYDVPILQSAYEQVVRMSALAREFEDADRALARLERAYGPDAELRAMIAEERASPPPQGLIPLVIPARRPTPATAARFLGEWEAYDSPMPHRVSVRASRDTIVVRDWFRYPDGAIDEGDHQVIQVTDAGSLEWGLPWFRGVAALLVLKATIEPDGTMTLRREPRGWVPRGPGRDANVVERLRRRTP